MKKLFFFLSAIALLGLASACVEQISSDNPNYNAEKGEVKTEFVINIASTAQTKATAAEVQAEATNTFRGMEGIRLFMSKGYNTAYLTDYVYDLKDFTPIYTGVTNLTQAGSITSDNSRKVYKMAMPTGVDNMVFYAKAPASTGSKNAIVYPFNTGTTTSDTPADPTTKTATNFALVPITADATVFTTNASATALRGILNAVAAAEGWSTTDDVTLATAYHNFVNTQAISEETTVNDDNTTTTTPIPETLRQGSAAGVLRTMQDLYLIVVKRTDAVSSAIKTVLEGYFDTDADASTNPPTPATKLTGYKSTAGVVSNFPENLGLPVGAAQVKCTVNGTTATFEWVNPANTLETNTVDYKNLMFPPELCYWADSPIRVSNTEGAEGVDGNDPGFYPNGVTNWNNDAAWTNATGNWLAWATNKAVTKDTRAVALKNNVLYGVALLKATVALGVDKTNNNTPLTTLDDNRKALVPHLTDKPIDVDGKFKVKGILIGGQPKMVGWNFVAKDADRTGVIYDNVVNNTNAITTSASNPAFYTMVFDNYNTAGAQDVFFALELENNAGDFYGKDNIIYNGGTFYLAGKMDKNQLDEAYTQLTNLKTLGYRIPPVDENTGDMTATPRIFMQDFFTTVTITLGKDALKKAYATIPDLRPIDMYFGLSVDLSWKAGAALSVEL